MAKRYEQMIRLIDKIRPRTIVEVGVHGALRANMLCRRALLYGRVHYVGYDVFETMGEAFQDAALNGKGTATEARARERLDAIVAAFPKFSYELVIGDTRKTLHARGVQADFAFIDGDHRVDAIRGDYLALASSKCIALDDFYVAGPNGELPDIDYFGANRVVEYAASSGKQVKLLAVADRCNHGSFAKIAVVCQ